MSRLRVVLAPDAFKGSLDASEAAAALAAGWSRSRPDDEIVALPLADGGEGTLDAFERAVPGSIRHEVVVDGPDGRPVDAPWLALPDGTPLPPEWPVPQMRVPAEEIDRWRQANGLGTGPAVALGPGSVGPSKRWSYYAEAAKLLVARGLDVWVIGGPGEKGLADEILAAGGPKVRDLTGTDLRNGVVAMAAAGVAVTNDSGLMHIAAALGTPTIGIFGPTSPLLWGPLNPLAATIQTKTFVPCQPCHRPVCTMNNHACMRDIPATDVADITARVLADFPQGMGEQ